MSIKNVIIFGLGALGITYADKLKNICNLKILADEKRIQNYQNNPPIFNEKEVHLEYIIPQSSFDADLIIIATKASGLDSAINSIKNFVTTKTIIISLINGISSEDELKKAYPQAKVLNSYFIGHSAMKVDDEKKKYVQDGVGKIIFEPDFDLENFFKTNNIDYEISNNILHSMWIKLGVNIVLNQLSAIHLCTVGELKNKPDFLDIAKNLLTEVNLVAQAHGIKFDDYEKKVLESIDLIANDGRTSMYQDITAKRKTEVDIFSGEIIKFGKIYNIKTPYNEEIYSKIKLLEKEF